MVKAAACALLLAALVQVGSSQRNRTSVAALVYKVSNTVCNGTQTDRAQCQGPPCNGCIAKNCVLSQWSAWVTQDGCNGLQTRTRKVDTQNNECGAPCEGALRESQAVAQPTSCTDKDQNCATSNWQPWSQCHSKFAQSSRKKAFTMKAHGTGSGCNASTNETKPCGSTPHQVNCSFADWGSWTKCSGTCHGSYQSRYRRFKTKSTFLGTPCTGDLNQMQLCNTQACPAPLPCKWSDWTAWAGCDVTDKYQMVRRRSVEAPPAGQSQLSCSGTTRETRACNYAGTQLPVNCVLAEWSQFGACTKTCEGGQKTRSRTLSIPPKNGGACPTKDLVQTIACNEIPCTQSCVYIPWAPWEACSMPCGPGTNRRHRSVDLEQTKAEDGGCTGTVKEVKSCKIKDCDTRNCQWADWQGWSGCTASCGGGTKRRNRFISVSPTNGGAWCTNQSKAEVTECNSQTCSEGCIDGVWAEWSAWNTCSKSCGGAYQSRHRTVAVAATSCGNPVNGSFQQFKPCKENPPCTPPIDCELSNWAPWSACSGTCFGIRQRSRTIQQFADDFGKSCEGNATHNSGVLKMVEGCNPGPGNPVMSACDATPARDCVLEEWGDWTKCPVTCGGGQEYRQRHILTPPSHSGKACIEAIGMTRPCHGAGQEPCARVCHDCVWQQWNDWGACTSARGQKWRTRNVQKHANYCGTNCEQARAKEATDCSNGKGEEHLFCSWTPWTAFEGCGAQCGPATKKSQRTLHLTNSQPGVDNTSYLFKGKAPLTCSGTQFNSQACPLKACPKMCTKTDCAYHHWSEWHDNRCTGLATRHRQMGTIGRCGGLVCNGSLIESRVEASTCDIKQDCIWNEWGAWSPCHSAGQQSHRARAVYKMPQAGGAPCEGDMVQTKPCVNNTYAAVDCVFQTWFPWSHCSVTCGVGWQMRNRATIPGLNRGRACNGTLKELQACDKTNDALCGLNPIGVPCKFDDWSEWSMCLATGQRNRVRHIEKMSRVGATACNGSLEELGTCGSGLKDCVLSDWTEWDKCDKTCGGGQTQRNRQVNTPAAFGGKPCDPALVQIEPCGMAECPAANCEMSTWTAWSTCSANCGSGARSRQRTVTKQRGSRGEGCVGNLTEHNNCTGATACPNKDCKYGVWTPWSTCTKLCGGGQQTRERTILTNCPAGAGCAGCPVRDTQENQGCNFDSCASTCTDGVFDEWGAWSSCSTTCMGGIQSRQRGIKTRANHCGTPVNGTTNEMQSCWTDAPCDAPAVACTFGEWAEWGVCSASCGGTRERDRQIATQGKGAGAFCTGSLQQTEPCWSGLQTDGSTGAAYTLPEGCPRGATPINCVQSEWSAYDACTAECGGGQQTRSRTITQHPRLGGDECPEKYMNWTQPCNEQACTTGETDCAISEWMSWSSCDACNGQRQRARTITAHPSPKGKACNASTSLSEYEQCVLSRTCAGQTHYCVWDNWSAFTTCTFSSSQQCGTGYMTRTRSLKASVTASRLYDASVEIEGTRNPEIDQDDQAGRLQSLTMAFFGGATAVGVVMAALRLGQSASRHNQDYISVSSGAGLE